MPRFLRHKGRSKRWRAAGPGQTAPMARAVGAGTRLPRRERARAAGLLPGGAQERGPAGTAAGCHEPRFLRQMGARNARAGALRTHGASGGRGDAPTAAGAGARGGPPGGWCGWLDRRSERGGATCRVSCAEGARNARAAVVRRKGGPCHSERRVGMGPARKRAATKPIMRTARAAALTAAARAQQQRASGDQAHNAHSAGGRSRRPHVRTNFFLENG